MRPSDRARGFADADEPFIAWFRDVTAELGWSASQVDGALDWYGREGKNYRNDDDLFRAWQQHAPQIGLQDHQASMVGDLVLTAAEQGNGAPPYIPEPAPMSSDEAARIRDEAQALMRSDRRAYDRNVDLQDRYHEAIEALGSDQSHQAALPSDSGARGTLIAQMQAEMKERGSPYWRSPERQQHYRELISTPAGAAGGDSSGGAGASPSSPAAASLAGEAA